MTISVTQPDQSFSNYKIFIKLNPKLDKKKRGKFRKNEIFLFTIIEISFSRL
jgi:hypothetical protein